MTGGLLGVVIAAGGGIWLAALGYPMVLSTLCRVPVLVADENGIRFPLMGPAVAWPDVASVTRGARRGARPLSPPVLQVYPADAQAAIRQVRPWLRREARRNLAWYGTPFILSDRSMDKSLDDIATAITQRLSLGTSAPRLARASERRGCWRRVAGSRVGSSGIAGWAGKGQEGGVLVWRRCEGRGEYWVRVTAGGCRRSRREAGDRYSARYRASARRDCTGNGT
jgi:hypothetical protein